MFHDEAFLNDVLFVEIDFVSFCLNCCSRALELVVNWADVIPMIQIFFDPWASEPLTVVISFVSAAVM